MTWVIRAPNKARGAKGRRPLWLADHPTLHPSGKVSDPQLAKRFERRDQAVGYCDAEAGERVEALADAVKAEGRSDE